jgi:predicted small integral membrane protein
MAIRYLKICLIIVVALLCLISVGQNVANLNRGYDAVVYVTSMRDHAAYPSSIAFALRHPALTWASYTLILLAELSAGLLSAKGAWDLWSARQNGAAVFNAAKTCAVLGAGTAVVVWFGLFTAVGGAYFGMWQTTPGESSLVGAFQYSGMSGLVLLFINTPD